MASLDHHIRDLGPLALPRARDWIDGDDDYLRALVSLDAPDLGRYLEEAVDDCEADVRELAVGGA